VSVPEEGGQLVSVGDVLSVLLQVVYLALLIFLYILLARFVLGTVMSIGRRWRPGRGAAAAMEVVWSVTDPPLKALRRWIPPLRIGGISLDLASIVLLVIVSVLLFGFLLIPAVLPLLITLAERA
jgi:YggT family protein